MLSALVLTVIGAVRVFIEPGPLEHELRDLLAVELGPDTVTATRGADRYHLRPHEGPDAVAIELFDPTGAPVLRRSVEIGAERSAALRALVVAVERALRVPTTPTDRPSAISPPAPPTPLPLWIEATAGLVLIGPSPQMLLEVSGRTRVAPLEIGLALGGSGLFCCTVSAALSSGEEGLEGELTRLWAFALAAFPLLDFSALTLALSGGGGLIWQSLRATPVGFAGPAPASTQEIWGVGARAGLELTGPLFADRWRWRLSMGAVVQGELTGALPPDFPSSGEALSPGLVNPYATVSVAGSVF